SFRTTCCAAATMTRSVDGWSDASGAPREIPATRTANAAATAMSARAAIARRVAGRVSRRTSALIALSTAAEGEPAGSDASDADTVDHSRAIAWHEVQASRWRSATA